MKLQRLTLLAVAALGLVACEEDEGPITPPTVPLAYVRYVHAVSDTGAVDFRMVDQLENSLNVVDALYRSISPYQGVEAGKGRKIRVFGRGSAASPVGPSIDDVQRLLVDTTLTFDANKYYTILHTGFARAGSAPRQRLVVVEDVKPTPGANQLAVRVFNLAPAAGNVDLYATATATAPLPSAPLASNLAYLANSGYRTLATGPLVLRAIEAGAATQVAAGTAPAGSAATGAQTAVAGSSISGSALSAFLFPAGVGNNASVTAPSITYMQDNRP